MEKLTAINFRRGLLVMIVVTLFYGCVKKTVSGDKCRTCTATYNTGSIAGGPTEVCSDEAETSFRNQYNYANKIECR
jgi:hypothetical protein